jgi:hypothetical protein
LTPLPDDVDFPAEYKITAMGCHKALQRALKRAPALAADEMRRLDTDRCEDMFLSLSPGVRQGDPQSVRAAVQVLALKAAINGYKSSELDVKLAPGPSWSSALSKEQTVSLFEDAFIGAIRRQRCGAQYQSAPRVTPRQTLRARARGAGRLRVGYCVARA